MKNVDAEAVDRAALRAEWARFVRGLSRDFGQALALAVVCLLLGGVAAWVLFQVSIATSAGFWYLTSSYVAFILGAAALALAWLLMKLFRFAGRKANEEEL